MASMSAPESTHPGGVLTTGQVSQSPVDTTAAGIEYQHYQLQQRATGRWLGVGSRTVPNPSSQFSMSAAQFGNSGNAKSTVGG